MVTTSTRGIWVDILCYMWDQPVRGQVTGSADDLAKLGNCSAQEFTAFMDEAERYEFVTVTKANNKITLTNRRMFRDHNIREGNRLRQERYRITHHSNENITPPSPSTPSPSPSPTPKKQRKNTTSHPPRALPDEAPWPSPIALMLKYNREATDNCPSVHSVSPGRMKKAQEYITMFPDEEWWTIVFRQYHRSKFLSGTEERSNGHKGFQPDLDWLLSKGKTDGVENCVKVHDGRYRDD